MARHTAPDYMQELINYGGTMVPRGWAYGELLKVAKAQGNNTEDSKRLADRWMQGYDSRHPKKNIGRKKKEKPPRELRVRTLSSFAQRKMEEFEKKLRGESKRNPGESADAISKGFHGRPVGERFEVEEEELYPDNLAVLGCLVELVIQCKGGEIPIRGFKNPYSPGYREGDEVFLAAADRSTLELVGGDQEIVNAKIISEYTDKQLVKLGRIKSIVYLTDKHHLTDSNGSIEEYQHDFGKKAYILFGKKVGMPELMYDTLNKTMKIVGGAYKITDLGIEN